MGSSLEPPLCREEAMKKEDLGKMRPDHVPKGVSQALRADL